MKLQELLDKKHVLFCIKDVMVMQKDTADSHSVCPGGGRGVYYTILFKKCSMYMNIVVNILNHCTKPMATEQIVLF